MQATKPAHALPPFYATDSGEICFSFQFATVQISYARRGSACLPSQGATEGTAGTLAEVTVWQATANSHGEAYGVDSFPFSPRGHPLGFASVEQVAAILHWASLLEAHPPLPLFEAAARHC